MSLHTHHLATKLQANWLAKESGSQAGQPAGKVDDLTSLSWLHTVSIMPNTASQSEEPASEEKQQQASPAPSTPRPSAAPKSGGCPAPQSHLQELLSKKFQIQQKTSVKKLVQHFKLLSQVRTLFCLTNISAPWYHTELVLYSKFAYGFQF